MVKNQETQPSLLRAQHFPTLILPPPPHMLWRILGRDVQDVGHFLVMGKEGCALLGSAYLWQEKPWRQLQIFLEDKADQNAPLLRLLQGLQGDVCFAGMQREQILFC